MSHYAVIHVDAVGVCRHLVISAPSQEMAWDCAERLYGDAWYLSAKKV
jgi:hypothetical protein